MLLFVNILPHVPTDLLKVMDLGLYLPLVLKLITS